MDRKKEGEALFKEGANCAQAVVGAFSDLLKNDYDILYKTAQPFGGGMGRLREVCGAVSGMFIVLGALTGNPDPKDQQGKKACYEKVQYLAEKFREENGSIICRELLHLPNKSDPPTPEKRTENYYKKRPCVETVKSAVGILEEFLKSEKII